jgi:hypothetical protein
MDIVSSIGITILVVCVMDWLFITRIAAYFTDFDYQYWPLSRVRIASVLLMISMLGSLLIFVPSDPVNPPLWVLIPFGVVMIGYVVVGYRDILIQRRAGYRTPPRYSGEDY